MGLILAFSSISNKGVSLSNDLASQDSAFITDTFHRSHDHLRISITEHCNLRCLCYMPEKGVPLSPQKQLLTTPEIVTIRLTAGKPTLGEMRGTGLKQLCITTKGIALHRKLDAMVGAGLTNINLSLDTLDPWQCQIMTRDEDIEVRFIEYMPFDGNRWTKNKMLNYENMVSLLQDHYPTLIRVSGHEHNATLKQWHVPGFTSRIGFITSMTHNLCVTCNWLRITSDGNLKICLCGNTEVSLRDILRKANNDEPIEHRDMSCKKEKARHAEIGELKNMNNRPMILIGG
ncbi:molybdenum cofactor synthesis C-domain-containing protein [Fusarium flagelliforme]|uniref:molybdenum cofactor synthesis C-domain-containing protein n=1 Tax=Fusarium flagelliforme TaxID=2675880 RepID=UPI001E8DDB49|nr:molybdenum cofactor synthesis C-domain-containing protein [Fusarium flagelliforme]KAH7199022.1 molybdenum cofactor synthesis C-domain-containing protein [Fusarium flagelliforme]